MFTSVWVSGMKEISICSKFTALDRIDSAMHYWLKTALVQVLEEKKKKRDLAAQTFLL